MNTLQKLKKKNRFIIITSVGVHVFGRKIDLVAICDWNRGRGERKRGRGENEFVERERENEFVQRKRERVRDLLRGGFKI